VLLVCFTKYLSRKSYIRFKRTYFKIVPTHIPNRSILFKLQYRRDGLFWRSSSDLRPHREVVEPVCSDRWHGKYGHIHLQKIHTSGFTPHMAETRSHTSTESELSYFKSILKLF